MVTVVLRGGSRNGESTDVAAEVNRLYAASEAPGLLDVYEAAEEAERGPSGDEAVVFEWVDEVPIGDVAPEAIHMPSGR